jgi:hypothetical protein
VPGLISGKKKKNNQAFIASLAFEGGEQDATLVKGRKEELRRLFFLASPGQRNIFIFLSHEK